MNDRRSTEHLLETWFEIEAPVSAPEALKSDIDRATADVRPRPAWLARLGGHHMDVIEGGARRRNVSLVPILVILALVLVAVAAGAAFIGSQPRDPLAVGPSAPASALTSSPVPAIAIPLPRDVVQLISATDGIYVSVAGESGDFARSIYRIDPATNEATVVVADLPTPPGEVSTFTEAHGSIWLFQDEQSRVLQLDGDTGEQVGDLTVGARPLEPALGFASVWVPSYDAGTVSRIDPVSGTIVATITSPIDALQGVRMLAAGTERMWAVAPNSRTVAAIDPLSNSVVKADQGMKAYCNVFAANGRVWLTPCNASTIEARDEATGDGIGPALVGPGAGTPITARDGRVWTPILDGTTRLVPVDETTLEVGDPVDLGLVAGDYFGVGFDSVWYSSGSSVYRLGFEKLPPG
jgi:streptogramin lyase